MEPKTAEQSPGDAASRRSLLSLDALSFFIADVQTGFGPFIAVYLATSGWSAGEIGEALSIGSIAAMVSQLPGGALVDRLANKRIAAGASCVIVAVAALLFGLSVSRASVIAAEVLHSFGSAMLGPAVAAVSLAAVGMVGLGERLGRNARFAALGNGAAAAILGAAGSYVSARSVFWLTAAFMIPGLAALILVRLPKAAGPRDAGKPGPEASLWRDGVALFQDRRILGFAACVALYHLGNAALLPLAGAQLAQTLGQKTNLVIAAAVVVPQAIVAVLSPTVGRLADRRGARLVMAFGFAAVPLRALMLAFVSGPTLTIVAQALDGVGAATFGVLVPLAAAELTRGSARFNLCLGAFGLATAAGATLSTGLAGTVADHFGDRAAFLLLAGCGLGAVLAACVTAPRRRG